jgi:hypothetical protein
MVKEQKVSASLGHPILLAGGAGALERRQEARYPTQDAVEVKILIMDGPLLPATIIDISRSGLRLQMSTSLGKGMRLEIVYPRTIVIFGEVRYCRRQGSIFHAGVLIEDVIYSKTDRGEHIHDDHLSLYVVGKGLTVPEVIHLKNHLIRCEACRIRFVETHAILNPKRRKRFAAPE